MEVRIKSFSQFIGDGEISENLRYHIDNEYSLAESIFRPGSISHVKLLCEARKSFHAGFLELGQLDRYLFESTDLGLTGIYQGEVVPLDLPLEVLDLNEEKNPKLNYPQRGGAKKYHVYVKNTKTGRIMKIAFADLKQEYIKGLGAFYSSGSRPGMTAHQWAMARVNAASPSKSWARVKKTK
jgi:hypothetical protein